MKRRILFLVGVFLCVDIVWAQKIETSLHRNPFEKRIHASFATQNIHRYSLSQLALKGTVQEQEKAYAILHDPEDHFYFVKLHDTIGLERATITKITAERIEVQWHIEGQIYTEYLEI